MPLTLLYSKKVCAELLEKTHTGRFPELLNSIDREGRLEEKDIENIRKFIAGAGECYALSRWDKDTLCSTRSRYCQRIKAYAGVTIRKTEKMVPHVREYEKEYALGMSDVMAHYPDMPVPGKNGGKRILVAFGSSQGLCGAFNEKIADAAADIMTAHDVLLIIGKKLRASIELKRLAYEGWSDSVMSVDGIKSALRDTVSTITGIYRSHEVYTLTLLFTSIAQKRQRLRWNRSCLLILTP